jgi:type I restriction-modification system DNA methylase subunit
VILANPPFGGKERPEVQQNFPIKTGETAFLFLQHFIKHLKAGGRAAIVIKNTFLSNSDGAARALRQELLESCNLHTVLDCPSGTFLGAGVKTVVLFFEKGSPARKVWYYQLDPGRNMGKTNALNDNDLKEFVALQARFSNSEKSWSVDVASIDRTSFDLSVKNPNKAEEEALRDPQDIIAEIAALDLESAGKRREFSVIERLKGVIGARSVEYLENSHLWRLVVRYRGFARFLLDSRGFSFRLATRRTDCCGLHAEAAASLRSSVTNSPRNERASHK